MSICEISLSRGLVALIDEEDYDDLAQFTWYALSAGQGGRFYAARRKPKHQTMHRRILPGVPEVDHINGNGLDNRRANLRPATHAQNMRNRRMGKNNTSGFLGVFWRPDRDKWEAQVRFDGRNYRAGYFITAEQAAHARDALALRLHGEYASLNFPPTA